MADAGPFAQPPAATGTLREQVAAQLNALDPAQLNANLERLASRLGEWEPSGRQSLASLALAMLLAWGLLLLGASLGFVAARRLGRRKLKRLTRDLGRGLWDLRGASPATLKALVGELPTWFKHGEWEQGKFLNHYLTTQWPFLDKAISDIVLNAASPALAAARPLILKTLEFDNFSLGTIAPRIVGIRHIESLEDATTLEVHLKWKGNPKIVLNVQSRAGISVGKTRAGIGMRIAVTDLFAEFKIRVELKPLVPIIPCFGALVLTIMEQPTLEFDLKALTGDLLAIPGLGETLFAVIRKAAFGSMMWPKNLVVPLIDSVDIEALKRKPKGILEVKVLRARGLPKLDLLSLTDPYVVIACGEKKFKTAVRYNNLDPEFDETFRFLVMDPALETLQLAVVDKEDIKIPGTFPTVVGELIFPVSTWSGLGKGEVAAEVHELRKPTHQAMNLLFKGGKQVLGGVEKVGKAGLKTLNKVNPINFGVLDRAMGSGHNKKQKQKGPKSLGTLEFEVQYKNLQRERDERAVRKADALASGEFDAADSLDREEREWAPGLLELTLKHLELTKAFSGNIYAKVSVAPADGALDKAAHVSGRIGEKTQKSEYVSASKADRCVYFGGGGGGEDFSFYLEQRSMVLYLELKTKPFRLTEEINFSKTIGDALVTLDEDELDVCKRPSGRVRDKVRIDGKLQGWIHFELTFTCH